jgi:hypothetical protein
VQRERHYRQTNRERSTGKAVKRRYRYANESVDLMRHLSVSLALSLAFALNAGAQTIVAPAMAPTPRDARMPDRRAQERVASVESRRTQHGSIAPTPAELDRPGAVVMPPPILRDAGRTAVERDRPLFALNLGGQGAPGSVSAPPPPMQPSTVATADANNPGG